mmetsp:Transcript_6332/g.9310  ORF Transcript_6332/g.9310 Transcript_6332/m.9310 type:complete len:90 (-) Transcript_6332:769-1038(-)
MSTPKMLVPRNEKCERQVNASIKHSEACSSWVMGSSSIAYYAAVAITTPIQSNQTMNIDLVHSSAFDLKNHIVYSHSSNNDMQTITNFQ